MENPATFFEDVGRDLRLITEPDGERNLVQCEDRAGYCSKHAGVTVVYDAALVDLNILIWDDTTGGAPRLLRDGDDEPISIYHLSEQPYLVSKLVQTLVNLYSLTGPTVEAWEAMLVEVVANTECIDG